MPLPTPALQGSVRGGTSSPTCGRMYPSELPGSTLTYTPLLPWYGPSTLLCLFTWDVLLCVICKLLYPSSLCAPAILMSHVGWGKRRCCHVSAATVHLRLGHLSHEETQDLSVFPLALLVDNLLPSHGGRHPAPAPALQMPLLPSKTLFLCAFQSPWTRLPHLRDTQSPTSLCGTGHALHLPDPC